MSDKNNRKYLAAIFGSGVMLAALAFTQNLDSNQALASENTQTQSEASLAIAGETEAPAVSETDGTVAADDGELKLSVADHAKTETAAQPSNDETQVELTADTEKNVELQTEAAAQDSTEAANYSTLETTTTGDEGIVALDVSGIVENCMPSIVSITNKSVQEVQDYLYGGTQQIESESASSGIIIAQNDTELLIATNNHVVSGSKEMTVCFTVDAEDEDDLVVPAVTKGTDSSYDLAVVAVKLSDIPADVLSQLKIATLGSSDNIKVGETAIAIGNALGTGQTVTSGIISAVEREITTEVGTFKEIQTDAAINLGCSGGALLNKRGEVIGINSAKATGDYAESMGYAIPIDEAIPILTNLINRETREVQENHGYLGITVVPVSDEAKTMYNMPEGAFVYEVTEGSAADQAGLKKGDIITKFDGITVDSSDALVETLGYYAPGETVTVELQTADQGSYVSKEVEVTLQEGTSTTVSDQTDDSNQSQTPDEIQENPENAQPDANTTPDQTTPDEGNINDGSQGSNGDVFNEFYDYFFNQGGNDGSGDGSDSYGWNVDPYGQNGSDSGL